jgi:hypothetical protein
MVLRVPEPFYQTIALIDDLHLVEFNRLSKGAGRGSSGENKQCEARRGEAAWAHAR